MISTSLEADAARVLPRADAYLTGWTHHGGEYAIPVRGAQFVIVESPKIQSVDDLAGLLPQLGSYAGG